MRYETILTHITGRVETISRDSSGEALDPISARALIAFAKDNPFLQSGFLRSVSMTGQAATLERFTRH